MAANEEENTDSSVEPYEEDPLIYSLRQSEGSEDMLTTLDLADSCFAPDFDQFDRLIRAIRGNTTISTVEIDGNALVCFTLEEVTQLVEAIGSVPELKSLFVRALVAPLNVLTVLIREASGLQKITLASVQLAGESTEFNQALSNLHFLQEVRFCNMGFRRNFSFDEMVRALAGLPVLEKIEIEVEQGASVTSEAMGKLCDVTTLNELRMSPIDFSVQHIQAMASALETNTCTELLELGLGDGDHTSETWFAMANMLRVNSALTSLTMISFDGLDDDACIALANALEYNTCLQEFSLSRCGLDRVMSTKAALVLVKLLRSNHCLTEYSMNSIGIGEEGLIAVAKALEQNSTLKKLNLQKFDADVTAKGGLQALLDMLQTNVVLEHIHPSSTIDEVRLKVNFWLSLNESGLRCIELNSNTSIEEFLGLLASCQDELDKLYYLLITNPQAVV